MLPLEKSFCVCLSVLLPPFSALESAIVVLFYRYSACLAREVPSAHV
ncbi:hypothetical protein HMPREF0239_02294 [Clostridium sp. ATCC BAA-442]|nr:hypothetical protein HMPREF0239_02294 [Clostridium sp. ATCC BAA-442]